MHFLKSLVFTTFSPGFYGDAVAKGGRKAFKTFTLFTILIAFISAVYFAVTFGLKLVDLPNSLDTIPDVSIENGILTTDPAQPYILNDEGSFLAVDVTGEIKTIPEEYLEGVLFTRENMIVRSSDTTGTGMPTDEDLSIGYNELLTEMELQSFELDKEAITDFLRTGGIVIIVLSPVFIFLGKWIGGIIAVFFISILGLIVLSASGIKDSFKKSFSIGLYAFIPVTYIGFIGWLLGKGLVLAGIDFTLGSLCCLIPLLLSLGKWGIFWGIGAYGVISMDRRGRTSAPVVNVEEEESKTKESSEKKQEKKDLKK